MSQYARWISVAAATALLLLLLSAVPAHAAKPEREVAPFEGTGFPFFPCSEFGYDFDVLVDFVQTDAVTTWRDSDGNITRIKVHAYGTGTIAPVALRRRGQSGCRRPKDCRRDTSSTPAPSPRR